jgi:TRAP-type C4-dicarboxylate transport system substrate-binding protein
MLAQQIELLGGAPVTIPTSEIYQGLQRGMIDAATTGWSGALTFKLQEVSKFGLEAPLGNATNFLVMNKRSYARLPEDMRYVLETKIGGPLSAKMGAAANEEEKLGEEAIRKVANFNVATVPDADMANLVDSMRPLVDEWVKRTPEGAKVLAAYHQEAGQK